MSTNRRTFLKASAAASAAIGFEALPNIAFAKTPEPEPREPVERAAKPLNILILGGTGFTGPEQVEYAIARGHKVTLINRNKTRPDFFKGRVEQLIGDLNGDMSALKGLKFDVVIDNPTTAPAWVRNAAQYLKGNTNHYIFISTISAYASDKNAWSDETDPTHPLPAGLDPYVDMTTLEPQNRGRYYGPLKAYSEKEVEKHYPGMNTVIRPGLIIGPLDRSRGEAEPCKGRLEPVPRVGHRAFVAAYARDPAEVRYLGQEAVEVAVDERIRRAQIGQGFGPSSATVFLCAERTPRSVHSPIGA